MTDPIRAALSADKPAVPEDREPAAVIAEPSDAELLELMHQSMRDDLAEVSRLAALKAGTDPGVFRVTLNYDVARFARAVLARWGHQPAPPAEVTPGPSIEAVGSLIAWLSEQACQAADAGQPTDAGMLTWAAQVIGERVDEDAPAPMAARDVAELALKELERTVVLLMPVTGHKKIKRFDTIRAALKRLQELENKADLNPASVPAEGEVAELVAWLRGRDGGMEWRAVYSRIADLLAQRHPAPVPVAERLPGDELCWWFEADEDCGYGSNWTLLRIRGSATGYTHWLPAHALPLPATTRDIESND